MRAALAMLAIVAAPVAAQVPFAEDESRGVDQREADRTLQAYADCMVKQGKKTSARIDGLLRMPSGAPGFQEAGAALIVPTCMPRGPGRSQMRLQAPLLRGALFDARYRRTFRNGPADFAGVPPLAIASEFDGPTGEQDIQMRAMGDCIARRDAPQSRAFALARADSRQADAAIAALRPALAQCVAQGSTLRFSRGMLRGIVGEAIYKLSVARVASPTSSSSVN